MKNALLYVGLGVFFFHFGGYWSATWWSKWTFLMISFSLIYSYWAAQRTSWWYLPLMSWVLCLSSVIGFQSNHLPLMMMFSPDVIQALEKNALYTTLVVLAAVWVFVTFRASQSKMARYLFCLVWALGTAMYLAIPNLPDNGGYFGNPSMGASLLACLLPFVWSYLQPPVKVLTWLLTAWAIHRTHTAIPVGVLAVVTLAYTYDVRYYQAKWLPWTFFPAVAGLFFLSGKHLLDTNGRYPVWELAYTWARDHGMLWTGLGAGSVQTLMPILQVQYGVRLPDYFIWLHSDWLQVLVEFGWVGLACTLVAFLRLSWKAFHRPACFASLMGFASLALFGYPLRAPIHAFCLLVLCCLIERGD